jgi:predicted transcriptional regulators
MSVNYKDNKNPIYLRRAELGLSQEELANKLEISRTSLVRYEKGENIPSDILKLLAKELDVSADYLLNLNHNKSETNEYLWREFALEDECIEKIRTIAHISKDRNYTLAIDTINYLFKYSNIELIEYIGEYLNTPLPKEIDYRINDKITSSQKRYMNEQRKYEVEKFIVLQELSKLFDQIKSSDEIKKKYEKYKKHIEEFDRPITKATKKQLNRLEIE